MGDVEGTRLWHDDIRPPPEGWVWVRTNGQAKDALVQLNVVEISMDHDLGLHDVEVPDPADDPDGFMDAVCRMGQGDETGYDLVDWMCEQGRVPEKVWIHSWNRAKAQEMWARFARFGYDAVIREYQLPTRRNDGPDR